MRTGVGRIAWARGHGGGGEREQLSARARWRTGSAEISRAGCRTSSDFASERRSKPAVARRVRLAWGEGGLPWARTPELIAASTLVSSSSC